MASVEDTTNTNTTVEEVVNSAADEAARRGVRRFFTIPGRDPFDEIEWETRVATIPGKNGPTFEQRGVEFPKFWSQTATNIVAQKYFRGRLSSPERESSVRQMIGRVVDTAVAWGKQGGYFVDDEEAETFEAELKAILVNQYASFNSPVWFNVGFEEKPQCSACFILSIEDSMESILDWIRREGVIFRGGSGSGVNLSKLRSSKEQLSKGGYASGPVSFMRGADASAGTIKSGGKTRRAAKMIVLDVDHPDIEEFIWCKSREEEKARVLEAPGDARVHTTRGLITFCELYDLASEGEDVRVYTHRATAENPADGVLASTPLVVMQNGVSPIVRLRFANGQELRCTPNHRLWTTNRGYVEAAHVASDDQILLNDSPTPAEDAAWTLPIRVEAQAVSRRGGPATYQELPGRWSEGLGELMGHLVGDGWITDAQTGWVYGGDDIDDGLLDSHEGMLTELIGGISRQEMSNGTIQLRAGSETVRTFFRWLGVSTGRAHEKR